MSPMPPGYWKHMICVTSAKTQIRTAGRLRIFASGYSTIRYPIHSMMATKKAQTCCLCHFPISYSVRYLDLVIIIPTFLYFVFLTWCLLQQWKVIGKRPLCAVLFTFVYMVTICGLVCKAIAMSKSYKVDAYKVQT